MKLIDNALTRTSLNAHAREGRNFEYRKANLLEFDNVVQWSVESSAFTGQKEMKFLERRIY